MLSLAIFLFVAFLMLFLGGAVFVNNPRARTHQFFLLGVCCWVIWMVTNYLENVALFSLPVRELFLRLDFASGPMANVFLSLFVLYFIHPNSRIQLWKKVLSVVPGLFLAIVSFTSWHLPSVFLVENGAINFEPGWTFPLYALIVMLYFVVPIILLIRFRMRTTDPHVRGQATSIAVGFTLTAIVTLSVNLFLQNVLPLELFRIGIYAMLFFEMGVAYAIIRHEFLSVRFIVVELLLLGILANLLTRVILANNLQDSVIDLVSFLVLLILGFMLTRGVLREIEQRARLEILTIKLQAANTKLKELDVLKTEFLSIASHQLRTPLAVTKGYVSMLTGGMVGKVNEKQKAALGNVATSTESLILLVNHLLDLTRIESGRLQIRKEPVDVAALCKWTVNFLQPRADEKALKITLDIPSKVPMIEADTEKMKEVIMNLLDNAIKYTEKGNVKVKVSVEHNELSIEVTDSGYGLTAQDKRHLFEKFSRGSASKNVKTTSGLGLYVCRKLVEAMGGEIRAESAGAGKGSTFIVVMPIKHPRGK